MPYYSVFETVIKDTANHNNQGRKLAAEQDDYVFTKKDGGKAVLSSRQLPAILVKKEIFEQVA